MPSTPERYQWYAALLHEPVTKDLQAFVDALDHIDSDPIPLALLNFIPSAKADTPQLREPAHIHENSYQEDFPMPVSNTSPSLPTSRAAAVPNSRQPHQKRWSLAVIAAFLIILVGGVFLYSHILQTGSSGSDSTVISCIEVTTHEQTAPNATTCTATNNPQIAPGNMVYFEFCLAPHSSYSGKGSMLEIVTRDNDPHVAVWGWSRQVQQCTGIGMTTSQPGHYHIKLYWSPLITELGSLPTTDQDFTRGQWHLQDVHATFDIT